jgi:hypothetical protein
MPAVIAPASRVSLPLNHSLLPKLSLLLGACLVLAPQASLAEPNTPEQPTTSEQPSAQQSSAEQPSAEQPAEPWSWTVEGYGTLPWVDATTTIRGFETDTNLTPGQALNLLQSAVALRASGEWQRIGLLVDTAYTQLGNHSGTTTRRGLIDVSSDVTSINGIYDLALRYRFGNREAAIGRPGDWSLIPYAGARLMQAQLHVATELQGNGRLGLRFERQSSLERTWTQLLLGTQASLFLTPGVRVFARADVGGFGLAGEQDLSGNAQAGVGIALGNNTDLNLSWRYLGVAWSNGAERSTGFTSHQNGIELGLKFFF